LTEVRCKPRLGSSFITFNDRAYRGYLKARYDDSPKGIIFINIIDIEDYLKGVLPGEIGDRTKDEYEAVKAQAVAARTYAVWKLTYRASSGKLAPTVADQLYTGIDSEKEFLSNGIDDTQGEIATFKDLPIAAFYHAVCGGHTASVEKVWPERKPEQYLEGVDDKDYCSWAKSFSWAETFNVPKLRDALVKYFAGKGIDSASFDDIRDINFISDPETGRAASMEVITATGSFKETYDHIRWVLGRPSVPGAILPSTNFRAEKEMENGKISMLKIVGTGNGHGVGMCQCGAIGQSRLGINYSDILK
jgi:stage II sporulation protein D